MRILRLIENMTLGRNAVGYLTESMHGAGSPQAQRIQIARAMQIEYKKRLAASLAGIDEIDDSAALADELTDYFAEVFRVKDANPGSSNGAQIVDDVSPDEQHEKNGRMSTRVDQA